MARNAPTPPDAEAIAAQLRAAHEQFSHSLGGEGASRQVMSGFAEAYRAWLDAMSAKPETLLDLQGRYMQEQMRLWMQSMEPDGGDGAEVADKRFSAKEWSERARQFPVVENLIFDPPTIRVLVKDIRAAQKILLDSLAAEDVLVRRFEVLHPSLEDIFLRLT
ncbi:MAG: ATP-binding protein DrrA1-3 family domain-containing protein, partial [Usitatibacter sp.]